ncbi:MAG: DUF368 domain-containing protein [Lachnospiraceae bacterium]|nr:DUF368 domain-containing protein [Lachnospiraceae bacterium]
MQFIFNIIKGAIIGIANVIPGVSGGTMAVSLGIYERLIHVLTHIRKEWKRNIGFLVAIVIGLAIGIIGFAQAVEFLLVNHALITALVFVGLVLGGIPLILKSLKDSLTAESKKLGVSHMLVFVVFCALVVVMALLNGKEGADVAEQIGIFDMVILFLVGGVASAAMVIPGVSGSMLMMIFGYYDTIITTINRFIESLLSFDIMAMLDCCKALVPFGIGVLVGIVAIAKLIDFLFKKFASQTFAAILGLIVASPGAILLKTKNEYGFEAELLPVIIGGILLVVCFVVTCWFGSRSSDEKKVEK